MVETEKRAFPRRAKMLKAIAVLPGPPRASVDCVILDQSETGARLSFLSTFHIPDSFELRIPIYQECRDVVVRWRDDSVLGVDFGERCVEVSVAGEIDDLQRRIASLLKLGRADEGRYFRTAPTMDRRRLEPAHVASHGLRREPALPSARGFQCQVCGAKME